MPAATRTTMPPRDAEAFSRHLQQVNCASLWYVCALGGCLVPFFWVLDIYTVPDWLGLTFALRLSTASVAAALLLALRRWPSRMARQVNHWGFIYTAYIALVISVMCWLHEGYESPYYAGLNLVIVGAGLLFLWRFRVAILFCATIYLTYMVPLILGRIPIREPAVALGNQFFLIGTVVIILAAQYYRYRMERRWFFARLDLERTKQSLEEAYQRSMELDRLKSNFFSSVTHELRTPLTMILAPLEALMEDPRWTADALQREYLQAIRGNALRLLKLINDLLDLARLEEKYLRLRVENTDMAALLTEVVEYSRPLATRKDIAIDLDVDEPGGEMWVDAEKIERVVVNLLANALKFTSPGGRVCVWSREQPDELLLGVRDNGPGIAAEARRWVFERFRQADGSVTRRYGGTGIGLALAKELVELHGGCITVTSEVGIGSEFVVRLRRGRHHLAGDALDRRQRPSSPPAARRSDDREPREWTRQLLERKDYRFLDIEQATERRVAPRGEASRATKVVVIEDNVEILRFLSLQLRDRHSVYLAPDGTRGLDLVRRELPDVIITDYMMPGMDGVALVEALRGDAATSGIPIIMLTARNDVADRLLVRRAGADVYLTKPFSPQEVRAAVEQLLERRGQQVSVVAKEQVRSLEVISAGLAHEINNPLSYIANAVQVLGERIATIHDAAAQGMPLSAIQEIIVGSQAKSERMLAVALRGVERIRSVVDLVRHFAQAGYPREPVLVKLDEVVEEVASLVISPPDREIQTDCDLGAPGVSVRCLPGELTQVVRNLWQNALEAARDGGRVWVRTRVEGLLVSLEVGDDGPGIPPEVLPRIFTPFFTTKAPGRGMGLGLSIAHQLITRFDGTVTVDSQPGEGAVFRVRLPVAAPSSSQAPPS
ncbi:MAG: response regulator [Polyangiaceae bacterium]|nr:response regulator [Polyangiaceae bacterium]